MHAEIRFSKIGADKRQLTELRVSAEEREYCFWVSHVLSASLCVDSQFLSSLRGFHMWRCLAQ